MNKITGLLGSISIIEAILKDVRSTFDGTEGGGIGSINQESTNVYSISILREEGPEVLSYEATFSDVGEVQLQKVI